MNNFFNVILLIIFFCVGLGLLFLRDYLYRKQKDKLGIEMSPTTEFFLGDTVMPVVAGFGAQQASLKWSNKHQLFLGIFVIVVGIAVFAYGLGYLSAGIALCGMCFLASWSLQRWVPGYRKESVASQIIFILIFLGAVFLMVLQFV